MRTNEMTIVGRKMINILFESKLKLTEMRELMIEVIMTMDVVTQEAIEHKNDIETEIKKRVLD